MLKGTDDAHIADYVTPNYHFHHNVDSTKPPDSTKLSNAVLIQVSC